MFYRTKSDTFSIKNKCKGWRDGSYGEALAINYEDLSLDLQVPHTNPVPVTTPVDTCTFNVSRHLYL